MNNFLGYNGFYQSDFYQSEEWRRVRYRVLRKNKGKCELCGRTKRDGIILHVDHIQPRSKAPQLELDPNNLQVLCEDCNLGKGNRCDIDWRDPNNLPKYRKTKSPAFKFRSIDGVAMNLMIREPNLIKLFRQMPPEIEHPKGSDYDLFRFTLERLMMGDDMSLATLKCGCPLFYETIGLNQNFSVEPTEWIPLFRDAVNEIIEREGIEEFWISGPLEFPDVAAPNE